MLFNTGNAFSILVWSLCITFVFLMPCKIFSMVKLKYSLITATDVLLKIVSMKIRVPAELQESVDCSSSLNSVFTRIF